MIGKAQGIVEVSAVIIRKDGKREDLGIIASNRPKKKGIFNILRKRD